MPRPAAIFDLDGTLLRGTSAERLLLARALQDGTLAWAPFWRGMWRASWDWWRGRLELPGACKAYLAGAECERLESLAVTCVHSDVVPRLRPAMVLAVEQHRARGDHLVLLTGTPDFLAAELAHFLQLDTSVASRLERAGGRFTGRVLPPHPYGAGKRRALLQVAAELELDLAASHAYANRRSDAAHLELVGHAHAVAPDFGLRRLARRRGWSIVEDVDGGGGTAAARARG